MTTKHARRGFTLLELALATAVATVVIGAAMMLFFAVDRADRRLAGRFDRSMEVEQTRRALQNAFASIATSERPRPRNQPEDRSGTAGARGTDLGGRNAPGSGSTGGGKAGEGSNKDGAKTGEAGMSGDSVAPPPPPRIVLAPDTLAETDPSISALGFQRLEMVLSMSPVPVMKRADNEEARVDAAKDAAESSSASSRVDPTAEGGSMAIRGAFSLRPQSEPIGRDTRPDLTDRPQFELWWTPLPPAQEDPGAEPLPMSAAAGYPMRLGTGIVSCTWRFFKEGEWKTQHNATWRDDLPAYAEVQINYANGTGAKWLMEIDYTVMAEASPSDLNESGLAAAGGAAGESGGTPGRTVRARSKADSLGGRGTLGGSGSTGGRSP
jgi:prepilin-type N-terminal cleavage/methylation domain-containing protein